MYFDLYINEVYQQSKYETNESAITNLLRKGWTQRPNPPTYNQNTHKVEWDGYQWNTIALTQDELNERIYKSWTTYEFLKRFTHEERMGIISASSTNLVIADFMNLCLSAPTVNNLSQDLINGMNYLVLNNLLTGQRKDEILYD